MSNESVAKIFDKGTPEAYDERNRKLAPIADNLHFLIRFVLDELPDDARILCVGVGTGIEIVELAKANPGWRFVGADPSATMLGGCRKRLAENHLSDRCELHHGYISVVPDKANFNAALCLLVMHFLKSLDARRQMFTDIARRLHADGYVINAEISADRTVAAFDDILEKWIAMQRLGGASDGHAASFREAMKEHLLLLPPHDTETLMRDAGFSLPVQFFQSLLIRGWYAQKR